MLNSVLWVHKDVQYLYCKGIPRSHLDVAFSISLIHTHKPFTQVLRYFKLRLAGTAEVEPKYSKLFFFNLGWYCTPFDLVCILTAHQRAQTGKTSKTQASRKIFAQSCPLRTHWMTHMSNRPASLSTWGPSPHLLYFPTFLPDYAVCRLFPEKQPGKPWKALQLHQVQGKLSVALQPLLSQLVLTGKTLDQIAQCTKGWSQFSNISRHQGVHTGEDPISYLSYGLPQPVLSSQFLSSFGWGNQAARWHFCS